MSEGCVIFVMGSEVSMSHFQGQNMAVRREECGTLHMGSTQNTNWRILLGGLFFLMASECSEQRPLSTRSRWKMWKSCHSISCYHTGYISLPTSWLTALTFLGYHACHEIRWSELCCSWTCRGSIPCKGLSISTVPWVIKIKIRSYYNIKYITFNPLKYCFST